MSRATAVHRLSGVQQTHHFTPTCAACGLAWPCQAMIAKADAEYPLTAECEHPNHDADETTCGPAVVRVYVWSADTGELWQWGVQTLRQSAWESIRTGFLWYPMGLTVDD